MEVLEGKIYRSIDLIGIFWTDRPSGFEYFYESKKIIFNYVERFFYSSYANE